MFVIKRGCTVCIKTNRQFSTKILTEDLRLDANSFVQSFDDTMQFRTETEDLFVDDEAVKFL
jgi:hypothetical protein